MSGWYLQPQMFYSWQWNQKGRVLARADEKKEKIISLSIAGHRFFRLALFSLNRVQTGKIS